METGDSLPLGTAAILRLRLRLSARYQVRDLAQGNRLLYRRHAVGLRRCAVGVDERKQDLLPRCHRLADISHFAQLYIENEKFVGYLERYATKIGVITEDDTVEHVPQDEGVAGLKLASGRTITADLYADCSGFVSLLLEKTLGVPFHDFKRTLYNDRAVVGGWLRTDEPIQPYTTAETMNSGWCWRIDHEGHINRGYVYSSDFISDEDATAEFTAKNPKVMKTRIVRFRVGRHDGSGTRT